MKREDAAGEGKARPPTPASAASMFRYVHAIADKLHTVEYIDRKCAEVKLGAA
jgi:hypothetical protein